MRDIREGVCPLCSHNEILQAAAADFVEYNVKLPMSMTTEQRDGNRVPVGILNIWMCRKCGFSQWFAFDPDKVPIGTEYSTRLVKGSEPEGGPYR